MPMYRYINADHSLVLRDDHVIAWDAASNTPINRPGQDDELKLWHDAGSPKPTELSPRSAVPPSFGPERDYQGFATMAPTAASAQTFTLDHDSVDAAAERLTTINATLQRGRTDDVAELRQQVQALIQVLRLIIKEPKR